MSRRLSGSNAPALVSIIAAFLPGCRCDLRLDHAQRSPSAPDLDTESDSAVVSASVLSHSAEAGCPQARGAISGSGSPLTAQHLTRSGAELHRFGNKKAHLIDVTDRVSVTFQRASGGGTACRSQLADSGGGSPMRRRFYRGAVLFVAACTALAACSSSGSSGTGSSTPGPSKTITIGFVTDLTGVASSGFL